MNDYGQVIKPYECRSDFVPGYNDQDQPRESLPNGNYWCKAELGYFGDPYGTFYITTGDCRARDIHGGGSGLPDPYAPHQGWVPTLGCLRMQNADGEEVALWMMANGNNMLLEVVD
jgi:core protein